MAISKKNVPNPAELKLMSLEKSFHYSLAMLTKYVIQQENRLSNTLDALKVKLKKAASKNKIIKKTKKNVTKAIETQILKAQIAVDTLELDIALTTDTLNQLTVKADHLLHVGDLCSENMPVQKTPKIKTPVKKQKKAAVIVASKPKAKPTKAKPAEKLIVKATKTKKLEKPVVKAKAKPKTPSKAKAKAPILSQPADEEFNFSELFTPEMDLSFLSEPETQTSENANTTDNS